MSSTPDDRRTGTLAVVLAAGGGTRFHGATHKLLADIDGTTVAATAISRAAGAGIGRVLVITGAIELDLGPTLDTLTLDRTVNPDDGRGPDIVTIHNPEWAEGQATSLQTAVAEAERRGVDAIVVGLADQPFIDPEAWRRVAASTSPIAVATYDGRRRNPVRLHRSVWGSLPTEGDEGARSLLRLRPELVQEIPCPGSPADIDTLEDLESWQNRSSTNSP